MISLSRVRDFNLDHIFDCGQCFRWNREADGSYTGVAGGQITNISAKEPKNPQKGATLIFKNIKLKDYQNFWRDYLDMERDYGEIKENLKVRDSIISEAVDFGAGIRILKQEPWETLISFIISQNNNIPRIKGCIESLCMHFGKPLGTFLGREYYSFPKPEDLAFLTVEDLAPIKLGYRAEYIIKTAKAVNDDFCATLEEMASPSVTWEEAYEYLLSLSGVGPKVANCIALFGLGKTEAFPIDTWVKKVMHELYDFDEADMPGMAEYAEKIFGEYGGFAQQYLFYYITHRENQ